MMQKMPRTLFSEAVGSEKLNVLAKDLLENGIRMFDAYITLYCLENLLRDFIDRTLTNDLGDDYETKGVISNKIRRYSDKCRENEAKYMWLPMRGNKLVYYLHRQ
jgi:hypothetical protein